MSWVYVPVLSWVNVGMGMVEAGAAMKDEVDKSCGVWECVWGLAGCMYCRVCRCWGRYQGNRMHWEALPEQVGRKAYTWVEEAGEGLKNPGRQLWPRGHYSRGGTYLMLLIPRHF